MSDVVLAAEQSHTINRTSSMPHALRLFTSILLAFMVSGCTLPGQVDPRKVSSLEGTGKALLTTGNEIQHVVPKKMEKRVFIKGLDDKLLDLHDNFAFPEAVLLEPGKHTVTVLYQYLSYKFETTLTFVAVSETTYVVGTRVKGKHAVGGEAFIWIENAKTGEVVGLLTRAAAKRP